MVKVMVKSILLVSVLFVLHSCYNDKYDELNPISTLSSCDTINISYSKNISKVFSSYCLSCHNSSTQNGGVRLDTYSGVYTQVKNNRLLGSIKQQPGYNPMPPGTHLESCNIRAIEKWVAIGAPEN